MQLDPIKPTLKAPGAKRLKLTCDILLSTSAFKFKLRRYFEDVAPTDTALNNGGGADGDDSIQRLHVPHEDTMCLGRGSHSSTFRLNVSAFCGIRWVHGFPPVYYTGGHGEV